MQDCKVLVDHGLQWEKFCITLAPSLPKYSPTTTTAPSTLHTSEGQKRKRRSREEGVQRSSTSDVGQATILFIGAVRNMKETAGNLKVIWDKLQVNEHLSYSISADFSCLMPMFGLMSCSSSHPCLYCTQRRFHSGEWEGAEARVKRGVPGVAPLRTLGGITRQCDEWKDKGAKYETVHTQKYESCVSEVLVRCRGDTDATTVLEKVGPPGVHLLLGANTVLRPHCEKYFGGEDAMLEVLRKEVGVVPHSYQGDKGAFEGPQTSKILDRLEVLRPYILNEEIYQDGWFYYCVLASFKEVKDACFGIHLDPRFEAILADFAAHVHHANIGVEMPITPKLHVISVHLVQWCRSTGVGLARANEAAVEAAHHTWWEVWKHYKVHSWCFISLFCSSPKLGPAEIHFQNEIFIFPLQILP